MIQRTFTSDDQLAFAKLSGGAGRSGQCRAEPAPVYGIFFRAMGDRGRDRPLARRGRRPLCGRRLSSRLRIFADLISDLSVKALPARQSAVGGPQMSVR